MSAKLSVNEVVSRVISNLYKNYFLWDTPIVNKQKDDRILYKETPASLFLNKGVLLLRIYDDTFVVKSSQQKNVDSCCSENEIKTLDNYLSKELLKAVTNVFPDVKLSTGYHKLKSINCVACDRPFDEPVVNAKPRPDPKLFSGTLYRKISAGKNNKFHQKDLCNCIRRDWDAQYSQVEYDGPSEYYNFVAKYNDNIFCRECFWYGEKDEIAEMRRLQAKLEKQTAEEQKTAFIKGLTVIHKRMDKQHKSLKANVVEVNKSRKFKTAKRRMIRLMTQVDAQNHNLSDLKSIIKDNRAKKRAKRK